MELLSRLRAWLAGSTGDGENAESEAGAGPPAEDDTAEGEDGGSTGLNPSAATETRTEATDDAVDALRDVRRSHEAASAGEAVEGSNGSADEADGNDGDRDVP